jgi:hypothetical protein
VFIPKYRRIGTVEVLEEGEIEISQRDGEHLPGES